MTKRVAILGGGVAGMSAAHELCTRGFDVHVYERNERLGGKARSFPAHGSGKAARLGLPAEHGFRFFPGFYQHLPRTMEEIPAGDGSVHDNLVQGDFLQVARSGGQSEFFAPAGSIGSLTELRQTVDFLLTYAGRLGVERGLLIGFMQRFVQLMSSCEERLEQDQEHVSWWDFSGAQATKSKAYRNYFADGMTRTMVAARAREMSARTAGSILLQITYDMALGHLDHVLNAPTNEAWLDPWRHYLEQESVDKRPVTFHLGTRVTAFHCSHGRITGVTVKEGGSTCDVTADYYIAALPVGVMRKLVTDEMKAAEPKLAGLEKVEERWMNGVMFYLENEAKIVNGHTIYMDSPWAVTSVSQGQFWADGCFDLAVQSNGRVKDILSVDVSDWDTPGLCGKPARQCTAAEIKQEVWEQISSHLNDDADCELGNAGYLDAVIDPAIEFGANGVENDEPLLINKKGTLRHRPPAVTRIENLMLASDYVRTKTDLATMEGANEAARTAVNGILDAERSDEERCWVKGLQHPAFVDAWRIADLLEFRLGIPNLVSRIDLSRIFGVTEVTVESHLAMLEWYLNQPRAPGATPEVTAPIEVAPPG